MPSTTSPSVIGLPDEAVARSGLHSDFWVGSFFAGVGAVVWQQGASLRLGTAANMGPGFVPLWIGIGLVIVGTAIALLALRRSATEEDGAGFGSLSIIQPIAVTTAALLAFSLSLDSWGLFIASGLLVAISRLESWIARPLEIVGLAAILAAVNIGIFRYGLSVPVPVWPLS